MTHHTTNIKGHQIELINEKTIFGSAKGYGYYPYILEEGKEWNNLFCDIRQNVKDYFHYNDIAFWNGKITGNTLSSQISCLNHLFLIRKDIKTVKSVIQSLVGERMQIDSMVKVESKMEKYDAQYIAFEMVSDINRLKEKSLSRGKYCTSIDAFAIAQDVDGNKRIIVMEWKLVENDSGNKAPTKETSNNTEEIRRGKIRVEDVYGNLIQESKALKHKYAINDFFNSSLFHLPFYELMRQTLWAEYNKVDFGASDYFHINVIPVDNPMRSKKYRFVDNTKGIEESWRKHLTPYGDERYIVVDPYSVVEAIENANHSKYSDLIAYLKKRYYSYNKDS